MPKFIDYSTFQYDIFQRVANTNDSLKILAVAGSGKTSTIVDCLKLIDSSESTVFLALNNFIVDSLKERIEKRKNILISTVHSLGWQSVIIKYHRKKPIMDKNKLIGKIEKYCNANDIDRKRKGYYFYMISKIVHLMKSSLVSNIEEAEELCLKHDIFFFDNELEIALQVLADSVKDTKRFDFSDMIYFPATHDDIVMRKFDNIFIDESQDLSSAAHAIIKKIMHKDSRLITVGDPHQAIYGFAGADINSYNNLSLITKMVDMPLSVCYRCAENIVIEAQELVPHIEVADGAEKGIVERDGSLKDLRYGDWILCRNVAPLVTLCLYLIKNDVKAKIRGKDIGQAIISLIRNSKAVSISSLNNFFDRQLANMKVSLAGKGVWKPEDHPKYVYLQQQIEVIQALSEDVISINYLFKRIDDIFTDEIEGILLSTIHKSKGLENDRILFLSPELIPNKHAKQQWQLEQEFNLRYVAITRAKKELIYIPDNTFKQNILFPISIPKPKV